jgi:uncharacterized domain HDIG
MPRDTDTHTPTTRTGSLSRSVRARRAHPGRFWGMGTLARMLDALAQPSLGWGVVIAVVFSLVCTGFVIWARTQPLVAVGRVMDETRLVRVPMTVVDEAATAQAKELARQSTPRVFRPDPAALSALVDPLETLPKSLASAEDVNAVDPQIREEFALTPEMLKALKSQVADGEPSPEWKARVRKLSDLLHRRPILEAQTWQRALQEGATPVVSIVDRDRMDIPKSDLINLGDRERLERAAEELARAAGFTGALRTMVTHRLVSRGKPTFTFDEATTSLHQTWAANAVKDIERVTAPGQIIFQRGTQLTQAQADLYRAEQKQFDEQVRTSYGIAHNVAIFGACFAITLALAGYTFLFCPRIRRNASRIGGVAMILGVALGVAVVGTAQAPDLAALFSITPTLFVALLLAIGYDRRAALAYALLHALLVSFALRETIGHISITITGIACVVWTVKEIRDRNSLFRTSVFTATGVGLATIIFGVMERPMTPEIAPVVLREIALDAILSSGGAMFVGGITLFMLPVIERAFNVTTGLTLIDLRDPKQPLLKELQFRAPGTYNHSLNVASIAEAAAEAIGGDSLLTYVGALYHDVGKMNKPEYFVENQAGGPNKHDKLSPAMSLLVVVGHVKDGMELAREFRLPGKIQHFIEAHHGTTLVEFFYHRARQLALKGKDGQDLEPDDTYVPDEFEYRYPGPRPRTKEVAILMIADAVESAARAMSDPTPSRIDALVRTIANKRLLDGQFDDCELTLRELHLIVESISRTVTSMYHGRIAYPQGEIEETSQMEQRA